MVKSKSIKSSEITPESLYLTRRDFMKSLTLVGTSVLLAACGIKPVTEGVNPPVPTLVAQGGDTLTSYENITSYNNYYEFTLDKTQVAKEASQFQSSPWQLEVYGLVNKPKTYTIDEILEKFPAEERIYRLRCVEAWSIVIPWQGFSLVKILNDVEPLASAKFVRFETIFTPDQMPEQKSGLYPWPYQEGLRLDEARHDLTILATGLYGKPLPPQDGAPIRLVVPWKYGFKSIKSIVKIELVSEQPATFWSTVVPSEYGFYANVNPNASHPRWSQATERRIGETAPRPTLMFNGYEEDVADLYVNMDLNVNY